MTLAFFDLESSGLSKSFDQICQFAAIRTDDDLVETGRFEIRSRLQPHIVPSPGALHVTGMSIDDLLDAARPSHYEMVCAIRESIGDWCPATFIGYNSLRFDEEFLRQAFYQCLHEPYLTNTNGSGRTDVFNIVRAAAALRPGLLTVPEGDNGKPSFKLDRLAPANGFPHLNAHDALADVEATIHLCRIVKAGAPDLWDGFLRFSRKSAVVAFVRSQRAFVFIEFFGAGHVANIVAPIGPSPAQPNVTYCLDLLCDADELRSLDDEELAKRLRRAPRPIRRVKVNASPLMSTLAEAPSELLHARDVGDLLERADAIRADPDFIARLIAALEPEPRDGDPSPHVEEQLYDGFWSDGDKWLLNRFHGVPWEDRVEIVQQLEDVRLRRLARRIVYFERPDLLSEGERAWMDEEVAKRRNGTSATTGAWLTEPKAIEQLEKLLESLEPWAHGAWESYRRYLNG